MTYKYEKDDIVRVRRKKDLLCMYKYKNDDFYNRWMSCCGHVSKVKKRTIVGVPTNDCITYGWENIDERDMYMLEGICDYQFYADDLEIVEGGDTT